jgi:hypothetical protein
LRQFVFVGIESEFYTRPADLKWLLITLCDRFDPRRERPHIFFPLLTNKHEALITFDHLLDNAQTFFKLGYNLDDEYLCFSFYFHIVHPAIGMCRVYLFNMRIYVHFLQGRIKYRMLKYVKTLL